MQCPFTLHGTRTSSIDIYLVSTPGGLEEAESAILSMFMLCLLHLCFSISSLILQLDSKLWLPSLFCLPTPESEIRHLTLTSKKRNSQFTEFGWINIFKIYHSFSGKIAYSIEKTIKNPNNGRLFSIFKPILKNKIGRI